MFLPFLKNTPKTKTVRICFNEDKEELKKKILLLKNKNAAIEVYQRINTLFMDSIPEGYIYKVTDIAELS